MSASVNDYVDAIGDAVQIDSECEDDVPDDCAAILQPDFDIKANTKESDFLNEAKFYLTEEDYDSLIKYTLDLNYLRITQSVTEVGLNMIASYHLDNTSVDCRLNQYRLRVAKSTYLQHSILQRSTSYIPPTEHQVVIESSEKKSHLSFII